MAIKFDPKQYWNERLTKHYDLIGVGDISLTMNYNKWSYNVTRFNICKQIKKYVESSPGMILDIGSGTGFVIEIWQLFKKQINGIDISPEAVKNLRQKFQTEQFFEIDAGSDELPFEESSCRL